MDLISEIRSLMASMMQDIGEPFPWMQASDPSELACKAAALGDADVCKAVETFLDARLDMKRVGVPAVLTAARHLENALVEYELFGEGIQ
jgi:hypothetical protein